MIRVPAVDLMAAVHAVPQSPLGVVAGPVRVEEIATGSRDPDSGFGDTIYSHIRHLTGDVVPIRAFAVADWLAAVKVLLAPRP
jgi:hypothetical protein